MSSSPVLINVGRPCFNVLAFPMTIKALCKSLGSIYSVQDLEAINLASLGS